jgi:hypothetical protein
MIVFVGFFAAIQVYVAYTLYKSYRASTKTGWHRYIDAAQGSVTILWSKFSMAVTALAGLIATLADYLGDPSIGQAIKSYLKPEYVAVFVVAVQVITIWARKRTL